LHYKALSEAHLLSVLLPPQLVPPIFYFFSWALAEALCCLCLTSLNQHKHQGQFLSHFEALSQAHLLPVLLPHLLPAFFDIFFSD
jgi:hypothetical protein